LQWIVKIPRRWVHWAPVRGGLQAQALLTARYKDSECFVLETPVERAQAASKLIAKPWWNPTTWVAQKVRFASPAEPVEMLWANMALHMAADPQALIERWHGLLAVDGFVMFSCLGPDTLRELRRVYAACGWPAPAHEFTDMHDWGDMLVAAGFAEPVMDMERITLTFASPERLLTELRELGRNLHLNRFPGLRGRSWRKQLHAALERELADPADGGRLKLSFEIIYGHAFKPAPRLTVSAHSAISLQQMRGVLGLDTNKERLP
jgi:malonyl-CoA O-methyltransferase